MAIIAIIFSLVGILGGFLPVIPGPPLSWIALLLIYFDGKISLSELLIWLFFATIITVMDYILPSITSKLAGGHKSAEIGAMVGLIAGIILTPVGMIMGCFLGAFFGEFLFGKSDFQKSLKTAIASFAGLMLSTGIKVIFSVAVLWQILSKIINFA